MSYVSYFDNYRLKKLESSLVKNRLLESIILCGRVHPWFTTGKATIMKYSLAIIFASFFEGGVIA